MIRPPVELRKLEDEERRRARAHRWLRWGWRLRVALWILGAVTLLVILVFLARRLGFSPG